ncbi:MBL fold metallo-hydrolase [Mesobacillus subterraneus]|uniref:MBL fold metallo-hydrolase n=1 Tax=Mesobacillus subterraneus TaxID=285983 RepID=A0A427TR06_9BACI|nr:MBL fold metallo-hydrolase [Mesobacillus subterraneus]RSD26833.1 MBL fold metallo-hydrolase [Mesobacillus subterraneus]
MENQFFTCTEIEKGVFAAIVKGGQGALGNAGFVDLGDEVLIFDTFMIPEAASALRKAAEEQTGKKVKYVVNSHYHGDHTNGNVIFKDAVIISTAVTRQRMQESYQTHDIPALKASMASYFAQLEERIANEQNEQLRIALEYDLSDKRKYAESLDLIEEVLPSVLFEEKLVLQGSERTVELYHFGGGHSESDLFMYLPEEQVLFAGDLVFVNNHAWMGHGNPHEWLTILEKLEQFDVSSLIAGHGKAGGHEDIQNTKDYIRDMIHFVSEMNEKGKSMEELIAEPMLEKYRKMDSPHVYEWNLNFLYGYLRQQAVSHS